MKLSDLKPKGIVPLFLVLTLLPLAVVGGGLVFLSFRDMGEQNRLREMNALNQARAQISDQVNSWKNIALMISGTEPSDKNLQRFLRIFPEIRSLRLYAADGMEILSYRQSGILRTTSPDLKDKGLREVIYRGQVWQGPAEWFEEGENRLPVGAAIISPAKEPAGFILADFSLGRLSRALGSFPERIAVYEGDKVIAQSWNNSVIASERSERSNLIMRLLRPIKALGRPNIMKIIGMGRRSPRRPPRNDSLPELGWRIELSKPWHEVYGQTLKMTFRFLGAIFFVAFATILFGAKFSKKAEKDIIRRERLAAIGQMANVVSHEMRTALAVIKNSLSFLKSRLGETDSKVARHLDIIECEVKTSNQILVDILSFSKATDAKQEAVDVNAELMEILESLPLPKNVFLKTEFAEGLPHLLMDKTAFRQAISNLLLNAGEAIEEKGTVIVQTGRTKENIFVAVKDTGRGIHSSIQKKIFEPFFTTKSQGTGLGLAIVKKIVERNEGKIHLESQPGEGTTVTLKFKTEALA